MEIKLSESMEAFFERCRYNIMNDVKNEWLGVSFAKSDEKKIQKAMCEDGFAEFFCDPKDWPTLFISHEAWENTPYHANVRLDMVKNKHFSYETKKVRGKTLFNIDAVQKDPNRELNDWLKLRAMDANVESIYLYQDQKDWMMDAPSEAVTNDIHAKEAHGKVLTFGLGIGYFIYMAMQNPNVSEITVVEKSPEVIAMFTRFLYPQFPQNIPLNIIEGDAFDYFNQITFDSFDYVYTDIWQSSNDGLQIIEKLLHQYLPPFEKASFWIEDSCEEIMWTIIFLYFDAIAHHRKPAVAPQYQKEMDKVVSFFSAVDETVTSVDRLKFYMYDNETIRKILSL